MRTPVCNADSSMSKRAWWCGKALSGPPLLPIVKKHAGTRSAKNEKSSAPISRGTSATRSALADPLGERPHVARLPDVVRRHRVAPDVLERRRSRPALANAAQHALDALGHVRARRRVEGAHGSEQRRTRLGITLCGRAAVDRADRHDRGLDRIDVARDDLLHRDDELCRDVDRIDREVRGGAVAALAFDGDLDRIARRVERAGRNADLSGRMRRGQMQSVGALDAEALEHAVLDHRLRAAVPFLGGLEQKARPCPRRRLGATMNVRRRRGASRRGRRDRRRASRPAWSTRTRPRSPRRSAARPCRRAA